CRRREGASASARGRKPLRAPCRSAAHGDRGGLTALDRRGSRHGHRRLHGPLGGAARQRRYGGGRKGGRPRGRAGGRGRGSGAGQPPPPKQRRQPKEPPPPAPPGQERKNPTPS